MRHSRILRQSPLIVLVLSALALGRIAAQEQPPVRAGTRIRVTTADLRQTGTLTRIDADTLVVGEKRVAVASVNKLEVSTGQKSRWLTGAGIGFLVGAGVGAVLGSGEQNNTSGGGLCQEGAGCAALGGVVLGAVGALVGAIVGSQVSKDSWQEVPLARLGVRGIPRGGSLSLTVALRF